MSCRPAARHLRARGPGRVLGVAHHDTLDTLSNLGDALGRLARDREAAEVRRELVAGSRESSGSKYPGTLTALESLGESLVRSGQYGEALGVFVELAETRNDILGPDDLETLTAEAQIEFCRDMAEA